jgi:hypothetical protein
MSSALPCGAARASPSNRIPNFSYGFHNILKLIIGTKPTFVFSLANDEEASAILASLILAVKPSPNSNFGLITIS